MHIIVFFVALTAAVSTFILYPRLRLPAGLLVAFFVGLIVYVFFFDTRGEEARRAERISPDELELTDVTFTQDLRFSRLEGRVRNLSERYRLRDFDIRVTMYDCPDVGTSLEDCAVIAQDTGIARVDLPPGQVRHFETVLRFTDVPAPEGVVVWDHRVTGVRASE